MQFVVQCHIRDPDRMQFQSGYPHFAVKPPGDQVFGFAASIAALLTIWPISLACSASDRI